MPNQTAFSIGNVRKPKSGECGEVTANSFLGSNDRMPKRTPSIFRNNDPEELTAMLNIKIFAAKLDLPKSKL